MSIERTRTVDYVDIFCIVSLWILKKNNRNFRQNYSIFYTKKICFVQIFVQVIELGLNLTLDNFYYHISELRIKLK